jgi:hypothetical protein
MQISSYAPRARAKSPIPPFRQDCHETAGIVDRLSIASIDRCGGRVSIGLQRQSANSLHIFSNRAMREP